MAMSSGGSSSGHYSGSRFASACADASVAEEEKEEVNHLSVSVLEMILACWLVFLGRREVPSLHRWGRQGEDEVIS